MQNYRLIIRIASPIALALLFPNISFFTNALFIGKLGEIPLGVNAICGVYYLILAMVGYGLSNGVQVLLSRRKGEKDIHGLRSIFNNAVFLTLCFSLFLILISYYFTPFLFSKSLHNQVTLIGSHQFLKIRIWGLPFLLLSQLLNAFFIVSSKSKNLMYGSILTTFVNIFLDYGLIFGKMGFAKLGLMGAAYASVGAEIAGFCVGFFLLIKPYLFNFKLISSHILKPSKSIIESIFKVSAPLIFQFMFSIGGWMVFFIYVEHLGKSELAASQILRSIFGLLGIFTWALATTTNTLTSQLIGEGKPDEVIPLIFKVIKLSLGAAFILSLLLLCFSHGFLALYRNDETLIQLAIPSLRMIVCAALIMSVSTITFNGVVGSGNTLVNLLMEITCVGLYLIYCTIVIQHYKMPLHWAWGSEFVYWSSLLLLSGGYLWSGKWKGKKI